MQKFLKSDLGEQADTSNGATSQSVVRDALVPDCAACDALILDANLRQSLVAVRSLGRRDIPLSALETTNFLKKNRYVPAFSSHWCDRSYIAPAYDHQPEPFLAYLLQLLDKMRPRVLFASSDGTVSVIRAHRAEIEKRTHIALAKESALEIAINKDQTLAVAEQLGISVPRGVIVRSIGEVSEAVRDIGLPAVVKPIETWLWGEQQGTRLICELVTTVDEARQAVEKLTRFGGATLFQQFLTGRREAVSFLYAHEEMYARFAQWAKRTQPPLGGTSVLRQSIVLPTDITAQAERLVRVIELEGYSEVEFRRDEAGQPYLMEINPRLSASVELAVRSGVDFPALLYQWACGEPIERIEHYHTGGWMRYLEGDMIATVQAIMERGRPGIASPARTIFDFCASFLIPGRYDYVDWGDPLPAYLAAKNFIGRVIRRTASRSLRRK